MPNRKTKPTSPGRRFATYPLREQVTAKEPERKLTEGLKKSGGRNVNGRVTARHRGGGAKRRYRKIDFKRLKDGVPAKVATIEYDPNRSCYIALLHYADGHKDYILAPAALKVGDIVKSGAEADIKPGHSMALGDSGSSAWTRSSPNCSAATARTRPGAPPRIRVPASATSCTAASSRARCLCSAAAEPVSWPGWSRSAARPPRARSPAAGPAHPGRS